MPGMTGLDLMTQLRQHWPTLPVVTVTAQIGIAAATYLIESTADECLLKPIDPLVVGGVSRFPSMMSVHRPGDARDRTDAPNPDRGLRPGVGPRNPPFGSSCLSSRSAPKWR
jgi:hypothetical protein